MRWAGRGTEPEAVERFYAVIPAGGIGSRLWPLSREGYPKQFWPLVSNLSLIQETAARAQDAAESWDKTR